MLFFDPLAAPLLLLVPLLLLDPLPLINAPSCTVFDPVVARWGLNAVMRNCKRGKGTKLVQISFKSTFISPNNPLHVNDGGYMRDGEKE